MLGPFAKYRAAAAEQYEHDGTLEIDADAPVSLSEDGGAYVQAWVWVKMLPFSFKPSLKSTALITRKSVWL